jgi:hypothetical protein
MTDHPFLRSQLREQQRFQAMVGQRLSRRYAAIAAEAVPEEFLTLLRLAEHTRPLKERMV